MIEHMHINQIPSFIRIKKKEHFTIKHVQKLLQQIKQLPSLAKVQAALKKHGSISCFNTDVGVEDGLTVEEISALERLNKSLILLEERLVKDFEVSREVYRRDKRKSLEMKSLLLTILEENLPLMLIEIMGRVCFESRKRISEICIILLKTGDSELCQIVSRYLDRSATTLIRMLTYLFECDNLVLLCGSILRKAFEHSIMVAECLTEDMFFFKKFFAKYMQSETFDVVSDAFFTVKTLMFSDTDLVADFLEVHGDQFAKLFNEEILGSEHYVTERLGLELLHDLLFERKNYEFMIKYVNKKENLILIMMKLRDSSAALRNDALHVFKVFVANPNKSEEIERILRMNRKKLVEFLKMIDLGEVSPEDKKQMFNYLESCSGQESNEERSCPQGDSDECPVGVEIVDASEGVEAKAAS